MVAIYASWYKSIIDDDNNNINNHHESHNYVNKLNTMAILNVLIKLFNYYYINDDN